jgi:hypothetical protein
MGEGDDRVSPDGEASPGRLEGNVESLRSDLGDLIAELDRRRHEAFDVKAQLRKHPTALAVAGVAAAAIVGGIVAWTVHARHEREKPLNKARRARRAVQRLMQDPEHMAREPSVGEKVLAAAGTAAASLLVKRMIDAYVPKRAPKTMVRVEVPDAR